MNYKAVILSFLMVLIGGLSAYAVELKVDEISAAPGGSVELPIRLLNQDPDRPVAAIQFTLTYDGGLLSIVSEPRSGPLLEGATVLTNPQGFPSNSGSLVFSAFTISEDGFYKSGENLLVSIPFQVKANLVDQRIPIAVQVDVATDKDSFEIPVESVTGAIIVDSTPPTTQLSITGSQGDNGWYRSDVTLSLSATDISGIREIKYKIGSGEWKTYSSQFSLSVEGITTVYYYSVDNVGNVEPQRSTEIKIDRRPPTTTLTLAGTQGDNDWYISNLEITLSASDNASGVQRGKYRLGSGSWQNYTGPFTVSNEGITSIHYRSLDNAGNRESERSISLRIDKTAPTGEISVNNDAEFTNTTEVTLNLSADDGVSGVDRTRLKNESGDWTDWMRFNATFQSWSLTSGDGIKTVYVQYKDAAGNESEVYGDNIVLDMTPPAVLSKSPMGDDISVKSAIRVEFSEEMNKNVTENAFSIQPLDPWAPPVEGSRKWEGNILIFEPAKDLAYCTTYLVTISDSAEDRAGNLIAPLFIGLADKWEFKTLGLWGDIAPVPGIGERPQGNGKTDVGDALRVARISARLITPTEVDMALGDVAPSPGLPGGPNNGKFGDGKLDIDDALRIARFGVGLIPQEDFPAKRESQSAIPAPALNPASKPPKLVVESIIGRPNETVHVKIRLSGQDPNRPIASIQFVLSYDGEYLSIPEAPEKGPLLTEKARVVTNPEGFPSNSGNLTFAVFTVARNGFFLEGEDLLFSIPFHIEKGTKPHEIPLTLTIETATDEDSNRLGVDPKNGKIIVEPPYGDVSGNGFLSAYDASLILLYLVGKIQLSEEQIRIGDVSGNGVLDPFDAVLILKKVVGEKPPVTSDPSPLRLSRSKLISIEKAKTKGKGEKSNDR